MGLMNETRIIELRRERGWTQEKLAEECGVGIRTIQRLEAGNDASLDTLSRVASALGVAVRELFTTIDSAEMNGVVDSLEARTVDEQTQRDRTSKAWLWLFLGTGVILSIVLLVNAQFGAVYFVGFWGGGTLIFLALRRLLLDPRMDQRFPLSRSKESIRRQKRQLAKMSAKAAAK